MNHSAFILTDSEDIPIEHVTLNKCPCWSGPARGVTLSYWVTEPLSAEPLSPENVAPRLAHTLLKETGKKM